MVDYYRTLDVCRTATTVDIKKAYRKLALRWHPDKNPDNLDEANRMFKEISEAYEVLIDENKRRLYDQYGKDGLQTSGNKRRHEDEFDPHPRQWFVFRDPEDVFREFFGASPFNDLIDEVLNGGGGRRTGHRHAQPRHPQTLSPFGQLDLFSQFGGLFGGRMGMDGMGLSMGIGMGGMGMGMGMNMPGSEVFTSSFGSMNYVGGSSPMRQTSTSTRFVNGKKVMTQTVKYGNEEVVMFYENDVLKSKTVNGVPQSLTLDQASTSCQPNRERVNDAGTIPSHASKIPHTDHLNWIKSRHHHPHTSTKHEKTKRK